MGVYFFGRLKYLLALDTFYDDCSFLLVKYFSDSLWYFRDTVKSFQFSLQEIITFKLRRN